jgi:hypothetical protein
MDEQFATPDHVELRVRLTAGDVQVVASERATTEVVVTPHRDSERSREVLSRSRIELQPTARGHRVLVELPGKLGLLGRTPAFDVRVSVPIGTDVDVATTTADVGITGEVGVLRTETVSGETSVAETTVGGRATTISGSVRIGRSGGPLEVRAISGDVRVGRCEGPLRARTVSGDLEIADAAGSEVVTDSVSGDTTVGIEPGLAVWLDLNSVSGRTSSELGGRNEAPPTGRRAIEVRSRSVSGSIFVRSAAVVGA